MHVLQAMGYLQTEHTLDVDAVLNRGLDAVLDRIKEIRLLMLERSQDPDDSLLRLPSQMEQLRRGLHQFARTALHENPYQDTPRLRGLFFSSGQQLVHDPTTDSERLRDQGIVSARVFHARVAGRSRVARQLAERRANSDERRATGRSASAAAPRSGRCCC